MYAPAHGSRLRYQDTGSGPPVVLLHGLGDTHDLWRHQLAPLAAQHRAIAADLRGHGGSPLGDHDFSIEQMGEDVARLIEEIGLDQPVVVGLSMGGGVAQALTIAHPELVRALVLVSTSSEFPDATRQRFMQRAAHAELVGMEGVIDDTVPRWFTPRFTGDHPEEVERTRRTVLATDPRAFAAASRANAVRDFTADLPKIRCPVLFVGGAADPADPERALAIYRRAIPQLRFEIVPDTAHLVPVEAPDTFTAILLRFLAEVESTPTRGDRA